MHSQNLNITNEDITIKDISSSKSKSLKIDNVKLEPQNDFLIIILPDNLEKDHQYEVFIPFKAELADGLKGFYKSSYTDKTKGKKWLGVTQFEPTSARQAFPCFDEPGMKAVFEITIGRKSNLTSVSNMPLIHTEPMYENFSK